MQPGLGGNAPPPQLPELVTNPAASLWPTDSVVHVAGRDVVVPAQPAAVWLELLMGALDDFDLDAIFPALADEDDQDYVEQALYAGRLTVNDLQMLGLELVCLVSGRPWWVAIRMVHIVEKQWSILGSALVMRGVDASRLSLSAWLDALWLVMFDHIPHDKWLMVSAQLEAPPPGQTPENPLDSMEMSTDQFTSLMRG